MVSKLQKIFKVSSKAFLSEEKLTLKVISIPDLKREGFVMFLLNNTMQQEVKIPLKCHYFVTLVCYRAILQAYQ